ncbi:MAG TPA: class A beta-lactamase [Rhizomicrobium sp.]|nr:class A beta-lactamase [Rhizomicrobium sp.]
MLNRRELVAASAALAVTPAFAKSNPFAALENKSGGRIGVAALDTGSGRRLAYRASERFPMCSTFKLLLVGFVLHRIDAGRERLSRRIAYNERLFPPGEFYAPVTRANLREGGMSVGALCAAAIEWSDNGAANLLLDSCGGPPAVTAFVRTLGDPATRLDRIEPALNTAIPGDPRDTTTPDAMLRDLQRLTLGDALSANSRARLIGWLKGCRTAAARIPAGLPAGWISGDKTGTGASNTANDVAIVWPPGRVPILVAAYYTGSKLYPESRDAVLAEVARMVAREFASS